MANLLLRARNGEPVGKLDPAEPDLGSCSGKAGDLGRALARDNRTLISIIA
ncbi:hypothetical protein K456DRAFT_1727041 [Colletotrichum gloeosporioides 23]|nr:hypothetical protein K456DRAFT_1727041 [Colletotrichum gloeosporioides 23]